MRKLLLLLALPFAAHAQINWKNYSTSFQGNGKEGSSPTLVTAIPYNGIYGASYESISPAQLSLDDSIRKQVNKWPAYIGVSHTIDSGEVYFLAPGLHPANAGRYEYRVLLDGHTTIIPWSTVTNFTKPGFALNEFAGNFGFLGGFKTTWGHSILVDIQEKSSGHILSSALVHWTSAGASLNGFYTASNLANLVRSTGTYSDWRTDSTIKQLLAQLVTGKLVLKPNDNTLIFHVGAEIYQRTALEYQLLRGGSIIIPWKPNDFDNELILLKDLSPGAYTLSIRLRAQRHNPSSYVFSIKPNWYESKGFQILLGFLTMASILGIIAVFTLVRQRRKTRREQATREKLNLELRSIRAQLNPHFVFNALSSIQGLVNNKDTEAANRYLSEFGHLLRDSLAISDKDFTELALEIGILDTYLKLEQLRFGFQYTIETAPDVDPMATDIPAFLLQPIVENAVKHGVSGLQERGRVRLRFYREKANFIAEVSDNGAAWDTDSTASGYGLRLTRERIRLLNQLLKGPVIEMTIASASSAGTATSAGAIGTTPSTGTTRTPPPHGELSLPPGTIVKIEFSNWWT
jgi:two-component system, LytTR family, sensor kinase